MAIESSSFAFRKEAMSVDEARELVWDIGNLALSILPCLQRKVVEEEIGEMFGLLDSLDLYEAVSLTPGVLMSKINDERRQNIASQKRLGSESVCSVLASQISGLTDLQVIAEMAYSGYKYNQV